MPTPSGVRTRQIRGRQDSNQAEGVRLHALDRSAAEIIDAAKRTGANVAGPVPLPTAINRSTVLHGPTSTRSRVSSSRFDAQLIDILDPTEQTLNALMRLDLSAGVDVEIKS